MNNNKEASVSGVHRSSPPLHTVWEHSVGVSQAEHERAAGELLWKLCKSVGTEGSRGFVLVANGVGQLLSSPVTSKTVARLQVSLALGRMLMPKGRGLGKRR